MRRGKSPFHACRGGGRVPTLLAATLATLLLWGFASAALAAPTIQTAPQGNWVGAFGAGGYALGAWGGSSDLVSLPQASLSMTQGKRFMWSPDAGSDVRALRGPDRLTRQASTWYHNTKLVLRLDFTAAYSGNLHLYAVDWSSSARRETITVDGQTATLNTDFSQGAWITFPVNVANGGSLTITVDRVAGANAVLSAIMLGEATNVSSPPQGNWVGNFGAAGHALGGWNGGTSDLVSLPNASVTMTQGKRYQWSSNASGDRALQSPDKATRKATTWYDARELRLRLDFADDYDGFLHLYAIDWDTTARRQRITVGGHTVDLNSNFSGGAWVTIPIKVAKGDSLTITARRLAGANAVISGLFLAERAAVSHEPQGDWVGEFGGSGFALGAWNGGTSDLVSLPNASLAMTQGRRLLWSDTASGERVLESPDQSLRRAATWYHENELRLRLDFKAAYTGNLHVYAVDWSSTERRQTITVGGQGASLNYDFSDGAWVSFPISVPSGGSVTITATRMAGANAVISGLFLDEGQSHQDTQITANPELFPSYDAAISDYVTRCSGTNPVQVNAQSAPGTTVSIDGQPAQGGTQTRNVSLSGGQSFTINVNSPSGQQNHFVRCLPAGFPTYTYARTGTPAAQWYIVTPSLGGGGAPYVALFNGNGVPVWWYKDTLRPIDAKVVSGNNLLWSHNYNNGFVTDPSNTYDERRLDGTLVRSIKAAGGVPTDGHDIGVTPQGNYITSAYVERNTTVDLSPYGGPNNARVVDTLLQEQTPAGQVVWSWNSKDHIALSESQRWLPGNGTTLPNGHVVYDIVHFNALQQVPGGLLISMRHTDSIYKIDTATGGVVWKLGGTTTPQSLTVQGDPKSPPFGGQHDIQPQPDGTVTIFDNGTNLSRPPRGVRYSIDQAAKKATFVEEQSDPSVAPSSGCCGSARLRSDGGWLIYWGQSPSIEEFADNGSKVFNLTFTVPNLFSYRAVPVQGGVFSAQELRNGMNAQFPR